MEKLREANVALVTRLPYFVPVGGGDERSFQLFSALNPLHIEVVYVVDTLAMYTGTGVKGQGGGDLPAILVSGYEVTRNSSERKTLRMLRDVT